MHSADLAVCRIESVGVFDEILAGTLVVVLGSSSISVSLLLQRTERSNV